MSGDHLQRVHAGQPFQPSAKAWNAFADTAEAFKEIGQAVPKGGFSNPLPFLTVKVKNTTTTDLTRGKVLAVTDGPVFTPTDNENEFIEKVILKGTEPAGDEDEYRFVVLREPIEQGKFGAAAIAGIVPAKVDVANDSDPNLFAQVEDTKHVLKAGNWGFPLIWREGGTGEQWGIVVLGPIGAQTLLVQLDAVLNVGSTADATIQKWTGSAWADTSESLTLSVREALGACGPVPSNSYGLVQRIANSPGAGWVLTQAGCSCNEEQRILITGSPTGGTFTLTFDSQTTGNINYNATRSDVRTALEGLSNIDSGEVIVTGGPLPANHVDVEFVGQYEGTDVAQMTAEDSGLTGGTNPAVVITTLRNGGA